MSRRVAAFPLATGIGDWPGSQSWSKPTSTARFVGQAGRGLAVEILIGQRLHHRHEHRGFDLVKRRAVVVKRPKGRLPASPGAASGSFLNSNRLTDRSSKTVSIFGSKTGAAFCVQKIPKRDRRAFISLTDESESCTGQFHMRLTAPNAET
jgi:hypothetical protein